MYNPVDCVWLLLEYKLKINKEQLACYSGFSYLALSGNNSLIKKDDIGLNWLGWPGQHDDSLDVEPPKAGPKGPGLLLYPS